MQKERGMPSVLGGIRHSTEWPAAAGRGVVCLLVIFCAASARAETLEVGPGRRYQAIEKAVDRAKPGDTVLVYPLDAKGTPYPQSAVLVRTARLTIRGAAPEGKRVRIDGKGFMYSGAGRVPRAIVQFEPGADGCVIEGFELFNASNESFNGAGVRINQANDVTVRNCEIHDNDMGIMSNGEVARGTGRNQRVEFCLIRDNGTDRDPGYNHNLYLGGTSVTLHGCEIRGATTGHNVKSRAHFNWIEYCYIHDSANRELDLVDAAGNTDVAGSHSVLLGNVIVKAKDMKGNRGVIHFGQDGGKDHQGTVYLVHNTIVTSYVTAVVELSAKGAGCEIAKNIFWDDGAVGEGGVLVAGVRGGSLDAAAGRRNWLAAGFSVPECKGFSAADNLVAKKKESPPFADAAGGDFRLKGTSGGSIVNCGVPMEKVELPLPPGEAKRSGPVNLMQYRHPCRTEARPSDGKPDLGAYEAGTGK
jgi:hypothetical protein